MAQGHGLPTLRKSFELGLKANEWFPSGIVEGSRGRLSMVQFGWYSEQAGCCVM